MGLGVSVAEAAAHLTRLITFSNARKKMAKTRIRAAQFPSSASMGYAEWLAHAGSLSTPDAGDDEGRDDRNFRLRGRRGCERQPAVVFGRRVLALLRPLPTQFRIPFDDIAGGSDARRPPLSVL